MNNTALLRNLIIYAICVPVAIIVGYWAVSAAYSPTRSALSLMGIVALVLVTPILLRWHHPLLVICWNIPVTLFFLPGSPHLCLLMIAVSLGISMLQRATNRHMHFIRAPQITFPLLFMILVVLVTAHFTGGIGLRSFGSETIGGKKYVLLLAGIVGYFALTARRIPPEHANRYVILFLLPGCLLFVGELVNILPSFIFLLIPPDAYQMNEGGTIRFQGIGNGSFAIFGFMLVRYGIRGIFCEHKFWRPVILFLSFVGIFFGGFRSVVALAVLIFSVQFILEGLHRTKLLPRFFFLGMIATMLCVPFSNRLPAPAQRALAFLPLKIDPMIRQDAEGSSGWRFEMWKNLLPEIPKYFWLGKGYAISQEDWEVMSGAMNFNITDPAQQGLALAGDYHNGPLSVILPFGIWGVIAVLWFMIAGIWALHRNFRYGDHRLQIINTALFAVFTAHAIFFFFVFGGISNDVLMFGGILGLSVSLNGGICRKTMPAQVAEPQPTGPRPLRPPRFQPAFPKQLH